MIPDPVMNLRVAPLANGAHHARAQPVLGDMRLRICREAPEHGFAVGIEYECDGFRPGCITQDESLAELLAPQTACEGADTIGGGAVL